MEISPVVIKSVVGLVFTAAIILITIYVKKLSSKHIIIKNGTKKQIEVQIADEPPIIVKPDGFRSIMVNFVRPDTVKVVVPLENGKQSVFPRTFEHLRNSKVVTQWTVFESPANVYRDHLGPAGSIEAACGE